MRDGRKCRDRREEAHPVRGADCSDSRGALAAAGRSSSADRGARAESLHRRGRLGVDDRSV